MKFKKRLAMKKIKSAYKLGLKVLEEKKEAEMPRQQVIFAQYPGMPGAVAMQMPAAVPTMPQAPIMAPEVQAPSLPEEEVKGISMEDLVAKRAPPREERIEELKTLSKKYPLTPSRPKEGEKIYAWAEIFWDDSLGELIYNVKEPPLSESDKREVERIKSIIEEKLEVHFATLNEKQAIDYLKNMINEIVKMFGMTLTAEKREIYEYYIFRDFIGLDKLQPLLNDGNIEDVSCDGVNVPIFIYHRDPLIGSVRTNVSFSSGDELDGFVMKLAQKTKKSLSVSEPLLQGALPDGSRVQATLGTDIARRGSNFTIRKFISEPLTPIHMMNFGTLGVKELAYLWFAIEHTASILVAGPTASGKTSMLNALSLFIKPSLKIVSIEDTPELRLPHPNWLPEVARPGFGVTTTGLRIGEISMFDLLKASFRQRPDYIIVGEVRGEEAYVLFQEMATGHAGMATLHADSVEKIVDRLTMPPINLQVSQLETLNIIVFIKLLRYRERYVRRVSEIVEVVRYDQKSQQLQSDIIFKWDAANDKFNAAKPSRLLSKMASTFGLTEADVRAEIANRIKILNWMKEKGITYYRDVGHVISLYYSNPDRVMAMVEAEAG